jgi:hypothetical protein
MLTSVDADRTEVETMVALARAAGDDDPRAGLAAAAALRKEAERIEAVQVRRARARGFAWSDIAGVLGVSKQAVHKKYGGGGLLRRDRG